MTLSTSEVTYFLDGARRDFEEVLILLVSGTVSATTADGSSEVPVMDATYASYSTAGDKIILTVGPNSTLRMKCASAGVVTVTW